MDKIQGKALKIPCSDSTELAEVLLQGVFNRLSMHNPPLSDSYPV
jgi:hypothetical protein